MVGVKDKESDVEYKITEKEGISEEKISEQKEEFKRNRENKDKGLLERLGLTGKDIPKIALMFFIAVVFGVMALLSTSH